MLPSQSLTVLPCGFMPWLIMSRIDIGDFGIASHDEATSQEIHLSIMQDGPIRKTL